MRRESTWLFGDVNQTTLVAANNAALVGVFSAAVQALAPFTIVRTRGVLQLSSDQRVAAEDQEIAYGMSIVSAQSTAIGVTAVPTPITDGSSDMFFVYEFLFNAMSVTTDIGVLAGNAFSRFATFDSKAMRKVDGGQDVAITVETSGTSEGSVVIDAFRMLIKLH